MIITVRKLPVNADDLHKSLNTARDSLCPFQTWHGLLTGGFFLRWGGTQLNFFSRIKYTLATFEKNLPTLYLCFRQKLMQFWMVSLLEVSLVPDRVGGSPLSLKQPKFPGTVRRQEEGEKKNKKQLSDTYNPYHMPAYTYMMSDFFFFPCHLGFHIQDSILDPQQGSRTGVHVMKHTPHALDPHESHGFLWTVFVINTPSH